MSDQGHDETDFLDFAADELGAEDERFTVTNIESAEWSMAKIKAAEERKQRRAQDYQRQVDRLDRWKEQLDTADDHTIERMTILLRPYFEAERGAGHLGSRKSLQLPSGRLTMRPHEATFLRDDVKLLEALQGRCTRTKAEVDWAELKQYLKPLSEQPFSEVIFMPTGEVLPGLTVQQGPREVFTAKPDID